MSHEYKCGSIFGCCINAVIVCCLNCFVCDCFCNCFFVCIDSCCICSNFAEKRLSNLYRFKFIFIILHCL